MAIPFQPLNQLFKNNQTNPMGIKNVIGNQPAPFPQVQTKSQVLPQGQPNVPVTNLVNTVTGKIGQQAKSPQDNLKQPINTINTAQAKTTPPPTTPNTTGGASSVNNQGNLPPSFLQNLSSTLGNVGTYLQQQPTSGTGGTTPAPSTVTPTPQYTSQTPFGQYVAGLANAPASNTEAERIRQQLADLQTQQATQTKNIESSPIDLSLATGQQGILNRLFAAKQSALSSQLGASLQSQQLQQQALQQAAGLAAPQPYGITTTPFMPTTGTFGTMPGGEGGAFGAGQVQGNIALGQQYSQVLEPAYRAAGGIKDSFQQFLAQNPNINPASLNIVNTAQQWLQGKQLSDPNQAKLQQFLTEFTNTLTPLIGSAGEATNFKQGLVNSLINSTASGASLSEAINNLYDIAGLKLQSIKSSGLGQPTTNVTTKIPTGSDIYNF